MLQTWDEAGDNGGQGVVCIIQGERNLSIIELSLLTVFVRSFGDVWRSCGKLLVAHANGDGFPIRCS